jgi:hypothetical protein
MVVAMSDKYECGLCAEEILDGDRVIRIAAESAEEAAMGSEDVLVFAVFHSTCVVETFKDDLCDDVPYIEEARESLMTSPLCDCCTDKVHPVVKERLELTLLRGGLT